MHDKGVSDYSSINSVRREQYKRRFKAMHFVWLFWNMKWSMKSIDLMVACLQQVHLITMTSYFSNDELCP